MNPEDHPLGKYDYLASGVLITRNAKPKEWPGFHKTLHEIRTYAERDEWDRQPARPDFARRRGL